MSTPDPSDPRQTSGSPSALEAYLRRLRWALQPLPAVDRDEIVAETRSHFLDRQAAGASIETIAAELGDAERYAQGFLENYQISTALAAGSVLQMLSTASRWVGRGVVASVGFFLALSLYLTAASWALVGLLKPVFPDQVGFWTAEGVVAFGFVSPLRPDAVEHLGYWIVPLSLALALVTWWLATRLLRGLLRRLRTQG